MRTRGKQLITSNEWKTMSLVLEISFLAIPKLSGQTTVQIRGFGPKYGFSP